MAHEPASNAHPTLALLLRELEPRLAALHSGSRAAEWDLTRPQFDAALERSVAKRFADGAVSRERLEEYLETLHIDDLVLASACMEGAETAWEYFVRTYRGYLRSAAGSLMKGGHTGADAQELADSLFAELFGLVDGKRGQASLFRYFHGRSSLKTWLRTVLAQRHIDRLRQSRRWEPLERENGEEETPVARQHGSTPPPDPHRRHYLERFCSALGDCLDALDPEDRRRLELYYVRGKTLAEIGRLVGEHESSASRNLERTRLALRASVEQCLRAGKQTVSRSRPAALSEAEIALCFEYAAEDVPIDFRQLFPEKPAVRNLDRRKESS